MADGRERFLERAAAAGLRVDTRTFPEGTRTAEDAAAAIGCHVGQIVKSLVFVASIDDREFPVLALTSGANRVDPEALAHAAGADAVRKADAAEAREATGYAIGGTPPFGHATALPTFVDPDLLAHERVWAAAGTPQEVFSLAPDELVGVTGGTAAPFTA